MHGWQVRLEAVPGGKTKWHLKTMTLCPDYDSSSPYVFTLGDYIKV